MPLRRNSCVLLGAVLLGLCGCSQARFVTVDGDHGVVAIPNNTNHWPTYNRRAAEELLAQKFPQGYVIDHEEEAVVGQNVTVDRTNTTNSIANQVLEVGNEHREEQVRNITEWRIAFHAKGSPSPPGSPPVPNQPVPLESQSH